MENFKKYWLRITLGTLLVFVVPVSIVLLSQ